jgi:hypothetical protein
VISVREMERALAKVAPAMPFSGLAMIAAGQIAIEALPALLRVLRAAKAVEDGQHFEDIRTTLREQEGYHGWAKRLDDALGALDEALAAFSFEEPK